MKHRYIYILLAILVTSCQNTDSSQNSNTADKSLTTALNNKKETFNTKASDEKKKAYAEGIEAVKNAGVVENAKQIGDVAPNFTLSNASGDNVTLNEEIKKGPVILMWYRGGWCPYCNITLQYMQDYLPEFKKYGAQLIALTPEMPDSTLSTKEKNELKFQVLSDIDNKVANQYGIVFHLTDLVKSMYESGFGLSQYNGNDRGELPLAATYVIDSKGVIQYAFLDADYRNRAEPEEIVKVLEEIELRELGETVSVIK